jgi:hypothetical protein
VAYPQWSMTSCSPSILAILILLTSWLGIFSPKNLLFLHVSCKFGLFLLKIWQLLRKKIPEMPFAKFAHDFVLRLWFKKIAKNQIKYHCTRGALLFTNIKYAQNTLRKFSKYFTYRKFTMAQAIQNDISKFFAYLLTKLFKIQWMN